MRESHKFRIETRERLVKEQENLCGYCNKPMKSATLEHIIPLELSDHNYEEYPENFIVVCKYCNKTRGTNILFSNLFDKELYLIVDVPYFFRYNSIIKNKRDN